MQFRRINSIARHIPMPVTRRKGHPAKGDELTPKLDANLKAIVTLRERQFSFSQIQMVLKEYQIDVSTHALYVWAKKRGIK